MTQADEKAEVEEVRVVVCAPELSAAVVEAFWAEGIAAYADYREDEDKVLLRDALLDGVEYIVFCDVWNLINIRNLRRKSNHDLQLRVYLRDERETKTMTVGAAIQMVLQRRRIPNR